MVNKLFACPTSLVRAFQRTPPDKPFEIKAHTLVNCTIYKGQPCYKNIINDCTTHMDVTIEYIENLAPLGLRFYGHRWRMNEAEDYSLIAQ
jgi:hypothetical protein